MISRYSHSCACLVLALAAGSGLVPAAAQAAAHSPDPQRLNWRISELEGELVVLRQFAQQQDVSIDQLQAQAAAEQARTRLAWGTSALLSLVCVGMAWRLARRSRQE